MNENLKTGIYLGVALLLAVAAYASLPQRDVPAPAEQVGKSLFTQFEDPTNVGAIEVTRFNESLGVVLPFKLVRSGGGWVIPTHSKYPADAEEQVREAVVHLTDLEVLGLASQSPSDRELYGVVEPDAEQLKVGDEGVGELVSVEDRKGKVLASFVVGHEVEGRPNQRFVRILGQDPIYVVDLNMDVFSTELTHWIEEDLLQLNPFDIARITLKNYLVEPVARANGQAQVSRTGEITVRHNRKYEVTVEWNQEESRWELVEWVDFPRGKPEVSDSLLAGEALHEENLNQLKTALDDLKIINVGRKPEGMQPDLKATGVLSEDIENLRSLLNRGFAPVRTDDGREVLGYNGELVVQTKDGVEYVLRFGESAGAESSEDTELARYLLASARVSKEAIPQPELTPLPGDDSENTESAVDNGRNDAGDDDDGAELDGETSEEAKAAEDSSDDAGEEGSPQASTETEGDSATEESGEPTEEADDSAAASDERERIERENQRKLDAYHEKLEKAQKRVEELNQRFGPWYYVVSDEVYQKLHLSKGQLLTESESSAEEGAGVDSFRNLLEEGLEASPTAGDE